MSSIEPPYGLVIGGYYTHSRFPEWGVGCVIYDLKGKLAIEFSRSDSKRILSHSAAQKLSRVPEGAAYINKAVQLDDGQLVVILDAVFTVDGRPNYKVFRAIEPRITFIEASHMLPAQKSQDSVHLMNDWFKFKKSLPIGIDGIRLSKSHHRVTHCYRCFQSGLDNDTDYECGRCSWIICPSCGACGCGYR